MPLPFIFLTLAIIAVWPAQTCTKPFARYSWLILLFVSILFGLVDGTLEPVALLPIGVFTALIIVFPHSRVMLRLVLASTIAGMSLALGLHLLPGFHNPVIVDGVKLAADSLPYTLHLNYDKALIGLFLLWIHQALLQKPADFVLMLKQAAPIALFTIGLVIILSLLMNYIRFDSKLPAFFYYWIWANLFFTCVAEEALFRGFLQGQLSLALKDVRHGALIALLVGAILFGLAHANGGINYVILATVAGLGYGTVYLRSGRIEASILLHFLLNLVHILFFSYPALGA